MNVQINQINNTTGNQIQTDLTMRRILGDVIETLRALPDSCLNMVYGDPDYGVGINYAGKRYTQQWEEYIDWYIALAKECIRVLRDDGNLFFINYPRQNAYLRVKCLDNIAHDVFDYAWVYPTFEKTQTAAD